MRTLKPYPSYRDSGLPWLGQVPKHWDVRRNGRLFTQRKETDYGDLPILEVSLRTGVRVRDFDSGSRKQMMADRSQYKRAAKGDLAYNMMRMWQGAVGVAPVDGLVSPAYVVAAPLSDADPRYYSYLFRTAVYMNEVNKFSRGIVSDRNRLYWGEFKQMPSAFPPTDEQSVIADFLDAHGRLSHLFIRNKRQLIALLNEQKRAIINQEVTRGLDPNVPMKPTGIEWMPKIPAHWELRMISRFAEKLQTGPFGSQLHESDYVTGGIPVINPMHLVAGSIVPDPQTSVSSDTAYRLARQRLKAGEIIIARRGELGRCALVQEKDEGFLCGTGCMTLRLSDGLPKYYYEFLNCCSVGIHLELCAIGATMQNLKPSIIGSVSAPKPPDGEQGQIVDHIEGIRATFADLIYKADREIALVREYRERLIADVITGKLDVRGVELLVAPEDAIGDDAEYLEETQETEDADVIELADVEE